MGDRAQRRGISVKLVGLAVLVVALAIVIASLGKCGAGFGVGSPAAPSSSSPPAEKADAAQAGALAITVDGERCHRGSDAPQACDALCRAVADEPVDRRIEIDGTRGTHAAVDGLRTCLTEQGRRNVVVRAE
jgi:hypothetical protein